MLLFVSHTSKDKPFARQVADSLALYGVPYFLDEREIKVGDNIPEKIYTALDRATHLLYVLSKNSIHSTWVQEELSVAKMRQLNQAGCRILPLLIDDVTPPSSVAHIKYADFRSWQVKEGYLAGLQELVTALELTASYATSGEIVFFQKHLAHLTKINTLASEAAQLYFQLERLWFYLFDRGNSIIGPSHWFFETKGKTFQSSEFDASVALFEAAIPSLLNADKIKQVVSCARKVRDDISFWDLEETPPPDAIYSHIRKAEERARELAATILSIMLEIQKTSTLAQTTSHASA